MYLDDASNRIDDERPAIFSLSSSAAASPVVKRVVLAARPSHTTAHGYEQHSRARRVDPDSARWTLWNACMTETMGIAIIHCQNGRYAGSNPKSPAALLAPYFVIHECLLHAGQYGLSTYKRRPGPGYLYYHVHQPFSYRREKPGKTPTTPALSKTNVTSRAQRQSSPTNVDPSKTRSKALPRRAKARPAPRWVPFPLPMTRRVTWIRRSSA